MRKISANLIVTNTSDPISNGVLIFDESDGTILDILPEETNKDGIEVFKGVLVPGYINAHCHLELSHLKGVIPTGTGLIPFIQGVVGLRDFPQEEIDRAILLADEEMFQNGIVAVGDISNKGDTAHVKSHSLLHYYTFVELFDFLQDNKANETFGTHQSVYEEFTESDRHRKSFVPHAPYSVSSSLYRLIQDHNDADATISIHNQELQDENDFFISKKGGFLNFYEAFGIPITEFNPIGKSSIHYTINNLKPIFKTLMVHNTCTSKEDIVFAHLWNQETYWVTCPRANLYIENRLPRYARFIDCDAKMCIGTDSLSSNWSLSIFEEMRTIKKYQSKIEDLAIIQWATVNGARALGFDDLGELKKGTRPGINLIDVEVNDGSFDLSKARSSTKIY